MNEITKLIIGEVFAVALWAIGAWLDPKKYYNASGFLFAFFAYLALFYFLVWMWNLPA